jgi:predicted dehydrogenase
MEEYRAAIVGARRGVHHAQAYRGIPNMRVVAVCDVDEARRRAAAHALGVPAYSDYEDMLREERPDIVHAVTMPTIPRSVWVQPASDAGVRALVVEKPLALRPAEAEALADVVQETGLKVIVNHQRRYMPFASKLRELLDAGLHDAHFVRASTEGEVMDMATHLMDVVLLAVGDAAPESVWATVSGGETYGHAYLNCPEDLVATYTFPRGLRVFFESTRRALGTRDFPGSNARCSVDIWATHGRFWWRENGSWGYGVAGAQPFVASSGFNVDDMPAQRKFTRAIADWLDDERAPHQCRLELALVGFQAIMSAYRSALLGRRLPLPSALSDDEWQQLRDRHAPGSRETGGADAASGGKTRA